MNGNLRSSGRTKTVRLNESQLRRLVRRVIVEGAAPQGGVSFAFSLGDNGLLKSDANLAGWWNTAFLKGSGMLIRELTKILNVNKNLKNESANVAEDAVFTWGGNHENFKVTENRAKAFQEELKSAVKDGANMHAYLHVPLSEEAVKFLRESSEYRTLVDEMVKMKWIHTFRL